MDPFVAFALLVTPDALRMQAAQLLALIIGNPGDLTPQAFSVPVCAIAAPEVITHWACHVRVRRSTLDALPQLAQRIPGGLWCVTAQDDDDPAQAAARPSAEAYLASQGLALYTPPDEEAP